MATESDGVRLSLAGRTALITGGSRGIGAATVKLFVDAGAIVAFNYRQATREAEALVERCGGGEHCVAIQQELSSPGEGRALIEKAVAKVGPLNILVANHGIWPPDSVGIGAMSDDQWRQTLDVNLNSIFGLVQAFVSQLRGQGSGGASGPSAGPTGHIVLVSSTAGQRGEAFHSDYAVTKSAVISLTRSLSAELAPQGIRVNCVAPGWVDTDMSKPAIYDPVRSPGIMAGIPVGRPGTPEEIAGPVLFLCTQYAGFMNGSVMSVNGGAVLAG